MEQTQRTDVAQLVTLVGLANKTARFFKMDQSGTAPRQPVWDGFDEPGHRLATDTEEPHKQDIKRAKWDDGFEEMSTKHERKMKPSSIPSLRYERPTYASKSAPLPVHPNLLTQRLSFDGSDHESESSSRPVSSATSGPVSGVKLDFDSDIQPVELADVPIVPLPTRPLKYEALRQQSDHGEKLQWKECDADAELKHPSVIKRRKNPTQAMINEVVDASVAKMKVISVKFHSDFDASVTLVEEGGGAEEVEIRVGVRPGCSICETAHCRHLFYVYIRLLEMTTADTCMFQDLLEQAEARDIITCLKMKH